MGGLINNTTLVNPLNVNTVHTLIETLEMYLWIVGHIQKNVLVVRNAGKNLG